MFDSVKSLAFMLSLNQKDCENYCRNKRIERFQTNQYGVKRLALHAFAHRILMPLLWLDQYITGKRLTIVQDRRVRTKKPVIFCPTHIGGADA